MIPSPSEILAIHENLHDLLRMGQAPVVRLLLRMRFLERVLPEGEAPWSAFGFGVARDLARDLAHPLPLPLPPTLLGRLAALLGEASEREPPPFADREGWRRAASRGLESLGVMAGEVSDAIRGAAAVPEIASVVGEGEGRALVPVVARLRGERHAAGLFREIRAGVLVPLVVRAEGMFRDAGAPRLAFGVEATVEAKESLRRTLAELERFACAGAPPLGKSLFHVRWDRRRAALDGPSCGLAFLAAAAAAYSSLGTGISRRTVSAGAALTGTIDAARAGPVGARTLGEKVAACFYGGVDSLWVPAAQREEALGHARRLEGEEPARQLPIRGIRSAAELWSAGGPVGREARSAGAIARAAFRRFALSPALVVMMIAAFLAGAFFLGREAILSRNLPVRAEWKGSVIHAYNRHGRRTLAIPTEVGPPRVVEKPTRDAVGLRLAVTDLDGDGKGEVVAIHRGWGWRRTWLTAFDRRGRTIWRLDARRTGLAEGEERPSLQWLAFYEACREESGALRIVAIRLHQDSSTAVVDCIDGSDGTVLRSFRNGGHIESIYSFELAADGARAFCLCGTENETRCGLLAILRPERVPPGARLSSFVDLPSLSGPEALSAGLATTIRFALDRFSKTRAHVRDVQMDRERIVSVSVVGSEVEGNSVQYDVDLAGPAAPRLGRVFLQDGFVAFLQARRPEITDEEIRNEEARLAGEVRYLTATGWEPAFRP